MKAILPVSAVPGAPPAPLQWGDVPEPVPGEGEVLLSVASTAVNRADLLQVRGYYPPPPGASPILGLEAAGVVVATGPGVTGVRKGETAMALLAGGGYAERVVVDARHLLPLPQGLGPDVAGAVPEAFLTAWLNLFRVAGLRPGERVLVHGGSGGVGTAAIQLARQLGAEVWTTAGGPDRCARCLELGAEVALDHRNAGEPADDFVARLAAEGGADVILDVMGASHLERNLQALAMGGRLVIIGLQGGRSAGMGPPPGPPPGAGSITGGQGPGARGIDLGRLLSRHLSIHGSTLRARSADDKAEIVAAFRAQVWPWLDRGLVVPVIDWTLPLPEAEAAHRLLAAGEVFGKLLLLAPIS